MAMDVIKTQYMFFISQLEKMSWLIWKDPDAGKYWRREEKGMTQDEMVEWHHEFIGFKSEQIPGYSEGQGSLL